MTHTRFFLSATLPFVFAAVCGLSAPAWSGETKTSCSADNGGLSLSPGFCATIFADNIGHARHMTIAPDGVLYVNTWSGAYYGRGDKVPDGGFIVALKDTHGVGHADMIQRLGDGADKGAHGGTGIAFYKGSLFVESNDKILRYAIPANGTMPIKPPEVVLSGMPLTGDHPMHPFIIDADGKLYVDIGSATNACQAKNRMTKSPGEDPCIELQTRAGTWRYDASGTDQKFSTAERYVTGLRNGEGFAIDASGRLFVTQHGRDQLSQNWPDLYTPEQSAELPAEEVVQLEPGADYGWPACYYDQFQKKLVLAPEYGGDGGKTQGVCAQKKAPVAAFPGHWAPNDMAIYTAGQFPAPYRGGAFIAFHGSWNRAPLPQGGYNVVFQPMKDGKTSGDYVVFADGFAGAVKDPGKAAFRPSGLVVGRDGALYISDDMHGRIWRVTFTGDASTAKVAAAPAPTTSAGASAPALPPEGIHPDAGRPAASLPVPPGTTRDQVALGDRIFHGQAANGTCAGCHGGDAKGTATGSDLTSGHWLWAKTGNLDEIVRVITAGVAQPKESEGAMPPMGGAQLSPADARAVAAYVWALGHPNPPAR